MASEKRKERTLVELYAVTQMITEPEITPVLQGRCQMQGPVDETDCDIQTTMVLSQNEEGFGRHCRNPKVLLIAESGTCNTCSAPCSSCLHINRAPMDSKTREFSDETCEGNAGSQYSVNDVVPAKSTACHGRQNTASETSNLVSVNSHDSVSENAESKACLRTCDVFCASEDVEMHQNLSSGVTDRDIQPPLKPQYNPDKRALTNKLEDQKVLEGHGESISCVTGGNDAKTLATHDYGKVIRRNVPQSSGSAELSSHEIELIEIPSLEDRSEDVSSPKVPSICSCPSGGKSRSCNPNARDLEENLRPHLPLELPECSKDHLNSSLTKEAASDMVCGQGSASHTCREIDDCCPVGGNSVAADKPCVNNEAETERDNGSGDLPTEAVNSPEHIEEIEVVKESCGLPGLQEASLYSQPIDASDGSDIVEHDVKVCDICGDAGRENLLAICIRCSDGAEHTYCMRDMRDKVPEGDWLCEECKFDDETKDLKQDKIVTVDGNDKNQSSWQASALNTNLFVELHKSDSDIEGNKTNKDIPSEKAPCKKHAENSEVASAVKRQALETTVGSPKASSPSRIAALSHDLSFRNLNKGKVKPAHELSSGTSAPNNTSKAGFSPTSLRLQTRRGTLLKSNSFNSSNSIPKVKLVDEEVLQKKKSAREPASLDMKEGAVRLMGKSMSFKSVNPGSLNRSDSKVKMLSRNFSHGEDVKGLKRAKEWDGLQRKNSFKSELSLVGSVMGNATVSKLRGDKNLAPFADSDFLPSVSNNREPKGVQSDRKLSTLSKSTSHITRRGSEMPLPLGEIKGQSCPYGVAGASSTNGINSSAEQKPNRGSLMYNPLSSTVTAERPFRNANEGLTDELPRPMESTNLGETIRESSTNHSRTSIKAGGRSALCQEFQEIGHSAQSCTVENARSLLGNTSASRSLREGEDKGNKLKAAIEAAMLRKPGIYRKNKMPDQSDELSASNTSLNCGKRPQHHLSTSINSGNIFSADEVHEGQAVLQSSTAESCEQTTVNNMKPFSALSSETSTSEIGDVSSFDPSVGQRFIRDLPSHATAEVSVLSKISIIPEHEYIWQGGFEVQKSGKGPEVHDGIQAHLSTCASPKVPEMVNKFPSKILLNEQPRLSMWPPQFQEIGVKEDNIALYLFAKDLDSYEKSYKSLLDTMMRNDLALRGDFEGVELLIFPSNHLPEKSQRWNTLYFLWGVFRGKKVNCLQDVSDSPRKYCIPRDLPTAIVSLPVGRCTLGPIDGDLPSCSRACNVALASGCPGPDLMKSACLSAQTTKEDGDINASSLDPKGQCTQANAAQNDYRVDATYMPGKQRISAVSFQETRCTSTPLGDNVVPESKLDVKPQSSVEAAGSISGFYKSDKMPMYLGGASDHQQISPCSFETQGRVDNSGNQAMLERTLKEEGSLDTKSVPQRQPMVRDRTMTEHNIWQHSRGKRLHEDSTWAVSQSSAGVSQAPPWNNVNSELLDGGFASKRCRTGCSGGYVCDGSSDMNSRREIFASGIHDVGTSSAVMEEVVKEENDETELSRNNETAERYFFPVYPRPVMDLNSSGSDSIQDDDWLADEVPSLELALGADMKPSKQGMMLPLSVGKVNLEDGRQDQPPDQAATKEDEEEEEEASASLSLSLAFPFLDKVKKTVKPVAKLLPVRQRVNTSLLLFEGLSEK